MAHDTFRNKLQLNFIQNAQLFIHENAADNIVCKMAVISFRGRWVNKYLAISYHRFNIYSVL